MLKRLGHIKNYLLCHLFSDERVLVTSMSSLDSVRDGLKWKIDEFE